VRRLLSPSVTARLGRAFGAVAALVVATSAAIVFFELRHHEHMVIERSEALARGLARAAYRLDEMAGKPGVFFDDPHALQTLVEDYHRAGQDDVVVVDRDKRIVADAIPANIGRRFEHDAGNEVGLTLADGRPRIFVETSADFPQGIHQMVVRLAPPGGETAGAVILDYERYRRETLDQVRQRSVWYALLGLLVLAAAIAATLLIGRGLLAPVKALSAAADTLARGKPARVAGHGRGDELDRLIDTFNAMAARLGALMENKDRDAARLAEMADELEARNRDLAHTLGHSERQNREIRLRNELGNLLHSCIGMDEAGAVIARFLPQLFPGASGAVYLHNSGSANLVAVSRWGGAQIAESLGLADCWALRRGKTHRAGCEDEALVCAHILRPLDGNAVCVPLAAHGETLGLLHVVCPCECVGRDAETSGEELLAEALAAQIGMALGNLRLRDSLRELAIRDALTGLYNRRYLEESLERELARAVRENRPLAVFMLDVDFFKRFNDDYGHEAGDEVLRALGQALAENARAGDLVCRFGGEEFTAVLPGASEAAAREWGERLRVRLRHLALKSAGRALPPVTVSLGLAVHPEHGTDRETLLQAADLALYEAKHAGRDRIAVSGEAG